MTLPRFTAGRLGPASHSDMNRVMAATEAVESMGPNRGGGPSIPKTIFARLTAKATGPTWGDGYESFEWTQVWVQHAEASAPWQWEPMPGGLSSSSFVGGKGLAVSIGGGKVGDIVEVRRVPVKHGDATAPGATWFVAVPLDTGVRSVDWGKTVQRVPSIGALGFPGYDVALYGGSVTYGTPSGLTVKAAALFELAGTTQDQVQNESPGTKTILDIPNGTNIGPLFKTGVPVSETPGDTLWVFTWPNAYGVVCQ